MSSGSGAAPSWRQWIALGAVLLEGLATAWLWIDEGAYVSAEKLYDRAPNSFIHAATKGKACTYVDGYLPHPYLSYVHHGDPPCGYASTNNIGLYGTDFPTQRRTDRYVVLLTGGSGFLGRRVEAEFLARGAAVLIARKREYDLVQRDACRRLLADTRPGFQATAGDTRGTPSAAFHGRMCATRSTAAAAAPPADGYVRALAARLDVDRAASAEAIEHLADRAGGDGRQVLTALEVACALSHPHDVELVHVESALGTSALREILPNTCQVGSTSQSTPSVVRSPSRAMSARMCGALLWSARAASSSYCSTNQKVSGSSAVR